MIAVLNIETKAGIPFEGFPIVVDIQSELTCLDFYQDTIVVNAWGNDKKFKLHEGDTITVKVTQ